MDQSQMEQKGCDCHKIMPIFLILLGLLFLLEALGVLSVAVTNIAWPILVILLGLKKMCKHK